MLPLPASSNPLFTSTEDVLRGWLQPSHLPETQDGIGERKTLVPFYKQHNFKLIWFNKEGLEPQGEVLLKTLADAGREGLNPADYHLPQFEPVIRNIEFSSEEEELASIKQIALLDLILTRSFIKYAVDLHHGRFQPEAYSAEAAHNIRLTPEFIAIRLKHAIEEGDLRSFFSELVPQNTAYRTLKQHLEYYETIRQLGGWQEIPTGRSLKLGNRSPRVPLLSRHLLITGDLPLSQYSTQETFAAPLEKAVIEYQERHGIKADGIVGRKTLDHLNVPVDERITQIKLNMERLRWLPPNLGARHLMVNIPGFELKFIQDYATQDTMRVIVGRKKRQTPLLSSSMTYMELNPYWNIPSRIARKDILPKVHTDPQYLIKNSIRVFTGWKKTSLMLDPLEIDWEKFSSRYLPYRFRQDPSPTNALGQVKFMFPNHQSIYIHDTPGKELFKKESRSFSSGCVRVEEPLRLAQLLLEDQQWDRQRITDAIDTQKRQVIVMKKPVPVYLVYYTAWADENDNTLNFRNDIYDRDQPLAEAMSRRAPATLWCGTDHLNVGGLLPVSGPAWCPDLGKQQASTAINLDHKNT